MPLQTPKIQTSSGISETSQQLMAQKGGQRRQFAQDQFLQARQLQQQQSTDANNLQMSREQTAAQQAMQRQELDAVAAGKELDRQFQQKYLQAQIAAEREHLKLTQDFETWQTKYGAKHAADLMRMEIEAAEQRQRDEFRQRDKEARASEDAQFGMQERQLAAQKEAQLSSQAFEKGQSQDYYAEMRAMQDRQQKLEAKFKAIDVEMAKARLKTMVGLTEQAMTADSQNTKQTIAAIKARNEAEQKDGYLKAIKQEVKDSLAGNPMFMSPTETAAVGRGNGIQAQISIAVDSVVNPVLASAGLSMDQLSRGGAKSALAEALKSGKLSRADFEKLPQMIDGAIDQLIDVAKPTATLMSEREYAKLPRSTREAYDLKGGLGKLNAEREDALSRKFLEERGKELARLKRVRADILALSVHSDPKVREIVGEVITQYHGGSPGQLIQQMDDSGISLDDWKKSVSLQGIFDVLDQLQGGL